MGLTELLSIAGKAPLVLRPLYFLVTNRPEMGDILRAALTRALCPGDRPSAGELAARIESRLWTSGTTEAAPGTRDKLTKRLTKAWRRRWKSAEPRFVDETYWRLHAAEWVAEAAADDEIRSMRTQANCYEAPSSAVELGKCFPQALSDEVNERSDSRLALQLAQRLDVADRRYKAQRRSKLKRGASLASGTALGVLAGKLGADAAHLHGLMDVLMPGVGAVAGGTITSAVSSGSRRRRQTRQQAQRWAADLRTYLASSRSDGANELLENLAIDLRGLSRRAQETHDEDLTLALDAVEDAIASSRIDPTAACGRESADAPRNTRRQRGAVATIARGCKMTARDTAARPARLLTDSVDVEPLASRPAGRQIVRATKPAR